MGPENDLMIDMETVHYLIDFSLYFIFSFIGSLLKEMHNANTVDDYDFQPYKVVTSTVVSSLISVALDEYFHDMINGARGMMGFTSLILGFCGFEIFRKISTLSGAISLFRLINGKGSEEDTKKFEEDTKPEKKEVRSEERPKIQQRSQSPPIPPQYSQENVTHHPTVPKQSFRQYLHDPTRYDENGNDTHKRYHDSDES